MRSYYADAQLITSMLTLLCSEIQRARGARASMRQRCVQFRVVDTRDMSMRGVRSRVHVADCAMRARRDTPASCCAARAVCSRRARATFIHKRAPLRRERAFASMLMLSFRRCLSLMLTLFFDARAIAATPPPRRRCCALLMLLPRYVASHGANIL